MINLQSFVETYIHFFDSSLGAFIFIILYALWVILLLPGLWPSMLGGFIYGSFWGTLFVFIGAVLGAQVTFFLGRKFLRNWTQSLIAKDSKFQIVEKAVSREGLKLIFLTRLSPAFPFSILNLVYGLTEVNLRDFSIGLLAILPGTFLYSGLGAFASDISNFSEVLTNKNNVSSLIFSSLGLVATFAVIFLASKVARKALQDFDSSI